jgi:hypothetical protein
MTRNTDYLCDECNDLAESQLARSVDITLVRFHGLYLRWYALSDDERREELRYCIEQLGRTILPPSVEAPQEE